MTTDLAVLPASSVPTAFDRGHLFSPTAEVVSGGIDYRPGDTFEPMPASPRGNPQAWGEWWHGVAMVETTDFLGLRAGDEITICGINAGPGTVVATYRWAALVRHPMPEGASEPYAEMYVRRRNHKGHWYR